MQDKNKIYKYRLKVKKNKELRFISHLDWQNLILKIFRRLELKLVLSEGFNKMPRVSYSPALPIFIESDCELINFSLQEPLKDCFVEEFDKYSPKGIEIVDLKEIKEGTTEPKSLENYVQWAKYTVDFDDNSAFLKNHVYNLEKIRYIIEKCLSSDEFLIAKKTKKGIEKTVNYRSSIKSLELNNSVLTFILKAGQNEQIPALRADEFLKTLFIENYIFKIKRVEFFDNCLKVI